MTNYEEIASKLETIELLPKQKKFLTHLLYNKDAKFLRYVGGFGSGKSFIGCMAWVILSYMYPKNLGIISRSTLVDLKNTTQRTFFEICELLGLEEDVHYKFDRHEQKIKFDNGSEIIFTGLDDIAKIKGMEPGRFYIDEVDEVDVEVFKVFQRRLRGKNTDRRIGFITSNSEWKNRTYQIFIKWETIPEKYRGMYYTFRASSLENKYLPDDYIDNLMSFDTDYFKRYVLGEFNVFEWQIFDEFTETIHIIDEFEVPEWRDVAYGLDHGLSNPTAIVEGRIDHDGNLYLTWEHYLAGKAVSFHAGILKERWVALALPLIGQPNVIADPSIFAKSQLPTPERPFPWSVADEYAERGVSCIRGNNEVLAWINRIKELLKLPKIYIFRSCKNLIKEVQKYRRAKLNSTVSSKEAPVKKDDHATDAMRYLVMAKLGPSKKKLHNGALTIADIVADDIARYKEPQKYKDDDDNFIP